MAIEDFIPTQLFTPILNQYLTEEYGEHKIVEDFIQNVEILHQSQIISQLNKLYEVSKVPFMQLVFDQGSTNHILEEESILELFRWIKSLFESIKDYAE